MRRTQVPAEDGPGFCQPRASAPLTVSKDALPSSATRTKCQPGQTPTGQSSEHGVDGNSKADGPNKGSTEK